MYIILQIPTTPQMVAREKRVKQLNERINTLVEEVSFTINLDNFFNIFCSFIHDYLKFTANVKCTLLNFMLWINNIYATMEMSSFLFAQLTRITVFPTQPGWTVTRHLVSYTLTHSFVSHHCSPKYLRSVFSITASQSVFVFRFVISASATTFKFLLGLHLGLTSLT